MASGALARISGSRKVTTQNEQAVALTSQNAIQATLARSKTPAQDSIELIYGSIGHHPQMVLGHLASTEEGGFTAVPSSGIDFHDALERASVFSQIAGYALRSGLHVRL
tara:strand:+ start:1161 stop:1487 length:327 start_codon:yes stop_codon:yes gene_type:complete